MVVFSVEVRSGHRISRCRNLCVVKIKRGKVNFLGKEGESFALAPAHRRGAEAHQAGRNRLTQKCERNSAPSEKSSPAERSNTGLSGAKLVFPMQRAFLVWNMCRSRSLSQTRLRSFVENAGWSGM